MSKNSQPASRDDSPALWSMTGELRGLKDHSQYIDCMVEMLSKLIPADTVGFNRVDLSNGVSEIYGRPAELYQDSGLPSELLVEITDHPMVNSYLAAGADPNPNYAPRRMSDIVSGRELHATRAYSDLMKPLGMASQLTALIELPTATSASCWTFTRTNGDFSDDDLELATRMQPLLVSLDHAQSHLSAYHLKQSDLPEKSAGLTEREVEVLGHLSRGLTAAAISNRLGVAQGTVRKHLEHAYAKLGTHDRLTAVDRARQAGLIPPIPLPPGHGID